MHYLHIHYTVHNIQLWDYAVLFPVVCCLVKANSDSVRCEFLFLCPQYALRRLDCSGHFWDYMDLLKMKISVYKDIANWSNFKAKIYVGFLLLLNDRNLLTRS